MMSVGILAVPVSSWEWFRCGSYIYIHVTGWEVGGMGMDFHCEQFFSGPFVAH